MRLPAVGDGAGSDGEFTHMMEASDGEVGERDAAGNIGLAAGSGDAGRDGFIPSCIAIGHTGVDGSTRTCCCKYNGRFGCGCCCEGNSGDELWRSAKKGACGDCDHESLWAGRGNEGNCEGGKLDRKRCAKCTKRGCSNGELDRGRCGPPCSNMCGGHGGRGAGEGDGAGPGATAASHVAFPTAPLAPTVTGRAFGESVSNAGTLDDPVGT